jgi:hypothetical protein
MEKRERKKAEKVHSYGQMVCVYIVTDKCCDKSCKL